MAYPLNLGSGSGSGNRIMILWYHEIKFHSFRVCRPFTCLMEMYTNIYQIEFFLKTFCYLLFILRFNLADINVHVFVYIFNLKLTVVKIYVQSQWRLLSSCHTTYYGTVPPRDVDKYNFAKSLLFNHWVQYNLYTVEFFKIDFYSQHPSCLVWETFPLTALKAPSVQHAFCNMRI